MDSYAWLREARNYLQTGTTCDVVAGGECRDTYVYAPLGGQMIYSRSLHIAAIVGVHALVRLLRPNYPLAASAMLVPIILGVLAVVPAFFIGRQVAGALGGLVAAVLIPSNADFLGRSLGSDNDAWNVVLPLFMVWAALAALAAKETRRRVISAAVAGGVAGLHAATWRGWVFTFGVVLAALVGNLVLCAVRTTWRASEARAAALVLAVFFVATALFTTLAGTEQPYVSLVANVLARPKSDVPADSRLWPDLFATVSELKKTDLGRIAGFTNGAPFLFGALVGAVVLLLPRGRWTRAHVAVLVGGGALSGLLFAVSGLGGLATVALLLLPLGAAVGLRVVHDEPATSGLGAEVVLVTWFLAGMVAAYRGNRFVLLLIPAFGLSFAAAVGRLYEQLGRHVQQAAPRYAAAARVIFFMLGAAMLAQPVRDAYATTSMYKPDMNDLWWRTLTALREHAPSDAIVTTWWDYGYWVKYAAERRVNADGSSLATHVPYWIARALLSATERESIGLLRMLNCGSDAAPRPEGQQGAYGKILAKVHDGVSAQAMVVDLASLDTAAAAVYLADHGFTAGEQADVLASTHCAPPETYLILSGEQTRKDVWARLAQWDFRKAYIAQQAQRAPSAEVIRDIVQRFGYAQADAAALDQQARALPRDAFAMPDVAPTSQLWAPCRAARNETSLHCTMAIMDKTTQQMIADVVYDPLAPRQSRLRLRRPGGGAIAGMPSEGTVSVIVLADANGIEHFTFPSPAYPAYGVLVDALKRQVIIGSPALMRSTFTQLLFLDGRYATHFEKVDDQSSDLGRVVTWKVKWDG